MCERMHDGDKKVSGSGMKRSFKNDVTLLLLTSCTLSVWWLNEALSL